MSLSQSNYHTYLPRTISRLHRGTHRQAQTACFVSGCKKMKTENKFTPPSSPRDCCFAFVPVVLASLQSQQASAFPDIHSTPERAGAPPRTGMVLYPPSFHMGGLRARRYTRSTHIFINVRKSFHGSFMFTMWGKKGFCVFVFCFFPKLTFFFFFFRKYPLELLAIIFYVSFALFPTKFRWNCV